MKKKKTREERIEALVVEIKNTLSDAEWPEFDIDKIVTTLESGDPTTMRLAENFLEEAISQAVNILSEAERFASAVDRLADEIEDETEAGQRASE